MYGEMDVPKTPVMMNRNEAVSSMCGTKVA
jgi:hypothetical protein